MLLCELFLTEAITRLSRVQEPPGLVCGAGHVAGMPDPSPEDCGHQGHLVPTPGVLQEGGPEHADLGRAY